MPDPLRRIGGAVRHGFGRFTRAAWWVHVLATLGAVVLVAVAAVAVLGVLFVDYVRERGPLPSEVPPQSQPSAQERADLARRFAPVLRYDTRELFGPIPRSAYVGRAQLKEQEGRFVRVLRALPTIDDLPAEPGTCTRIRNCSYFLDIRGVEPDPPRNAERSYAAIERQLLREGVKPMVYAHVTHYVDTGEYAVQYWFLYFRSGRHPVRVGCRRVIGSVSRCLRGRRLLVDLANGRGRTLVHGDYDLSELSGPVFVGSYGTGNYVVLTRRPSVLSDPRLRTLWRDPLRPLR